MSRAFRLFLVAAGAFLWVLVEWQRGPGMATGAVGIVTLAVILAVAAACAITYAGIFTHELGHAVAAVALTAGRPCIVMGKAPRRLRFALGRIDVQLGPRFGPAYCLPPAAPLTRARQFAVSAAGPFASFLYAGVWVLAATRAGQPLVTLAAVFSIQIALWNLIPREFERDDDAGETRTHLNDGARMIATIRNRPLVPAATLDATAMAVGASPRAEAVMAAMLSFAHQEGAEEVGTDHLLLALATADERTRGLLGSRGFAAGPREAPAAAGLLPPTTALRRVLTKATEAVSLSGHADVDPEHLLLGLLRGGDNTALGSMRAAGVDFPGLRSDVIAALAS